MNYYHLYLIFHLCFIEVNAGEKKCNNDMKLIFSDKEERCLSEFKNFFSSLTIFSAYFILILLTIGDDIFYQFDYVLNQHLNHQFDIFDYNKILHNFL